VIGIVLAVLLLPAAAQAETITITLKYNSGTGFFISREGHVLTNAHVVKGCEYYSLYTKDDIFRAELVATDPESDLALLKSETPPRAIAQFRDMAMPPGEGEKLTVIGFPNETVKSRVPLLREAKLMSLHGPNDEDGFLQFTDSLKKGNSGGPLFDSSGNVIGVVMARIRWYDTKTDKLTSVNDAAVATQRIFAFLRQQYVPYAVKASDEQISSKKIAQNAREMVVNVRCLIDPPEDVETLRSKGFKL